MGESRNALSSESAHESFCEYRKYMNPRFPRQTIRAELGSVPFHDEVTLLTLPSCRRHSCCAPDNPNPTQHVRSGPAPPELGVFGGLDAQEDGFRSVDEERFPPHVPVAHVDSNAVGEPRRAIYAMDAVEAATT
jgi:hypothetical protein